MCRVFHFRKPAGVGIFRCKCESVMYVTKCAYLLVAMRLFVNVTCFYVEIYVIDNHKAKDYH